MKKLAAIREQIVRADDKKPAQQEPEDKKPHQINPGDKKTPQQKPGDQKPPQQKPGSQKYQPCKVKNCHRNDAHKHHNIWYFGSANNAGKPGHGNPPKK